MLGLTHGVLLWADMNAATPLWAWGRSVISLGHLGRARMQTHLRAHGCGGGQFKNTKPRNVNMCGLLAVPAPVEEAAFKDVAVGPALHVITS